jgi:hypothetical protein
VVFAGIGVLLQRLLGMVMVVNMIESGPAHMSGLVKVGHCITEVRWESPRLGARPVLYIDIHTYFMYACVYIYIYNSMCQAIHIIHIIHTHTHTRARTRATHTHTHTHT